MSDEVKYACQQCARTDLTLTVNGRVRSHAANGKRASAENPHCPGGSDWPKHDHDYSVPNTESAFEDAAPLCSVCGAEDPRPSAKQLADAQYAIVHPEAPDEVYDQAEEIIRIADEIGVRPDRVLEVEEPDDSNEALRRAAVRAKEVITHDVALPTGTATVVRDGAGMYPNPHRPPLTTGSAAQDRDRGIPSADAFMDGETVEEDDSPRYFPAKYDGSCGTCDADFDAGDMIRKSPDGKWEGKECCGDTLDELAGQRPRATAPQLPVRNGRYQGPNPETGKTTSWTRSTTFAKTISDSFALTLWQLRMAGMGLAIKPDLLSKIKNILQTHGGTPYEVAKAQREILNGIMEAAKLAAGSKDRARKGTILHKHTQEIDMGRKSQGDVPEEFRTSVNAYLTAMSESGLDCIPDLIERSTMCSTYGVAGTFDRILHVTKDLDEVILDEGRRVQLRAGDFVIGDVKSGQDLSYAWLEILIQLALYAHGVDETGIAVPDHTPNGNTVWRWADLAEFGIDKIRTDVGIVMHAPYGERTCDLYYADLVTGWRGAKVTKSAIEYLAVKSPMNPVRSYKVAAPKIFVPAGDRVTDIPPGSGEAISVAQTVSASGEVVSQREMIPTAHAEQQAQAWQGVPQTPKRRTWEDVARAVTTKEEANKVWAEMTKRKQEIGMTRINEVVKIMRETLQQKGVV